MTITRSFGTVFTFGNAGGPPRSWYAGKDGIQRWSDNDQPVVGDADFIAAMSIGIPHMAPRGLDEMAALETSEGILALQSDNSDIAVSESAIYSLTPAMLAEGDLTEQRR